MKEASKGNTRTTCLHNSSFSIHLIYIPEPTLSRDWLSLCRFTNYHQHLLVVNGHQKYMFTKVIFFRFT